jgi:hypothetical protein
VTVTVSWYDTEKTILRYMMDGRWTIEEMRSAVAEAMRMAQDTPHVDVIVNLLNSKGIPNDLITGVRSLQTTMLTNSWDVAVIVTTDIVLYRVKDVLGLIFPKVKGRFAAVPNEEAAIKLIKETRQRAASPAPSASDS